MLLQRKLTQIRRENYIDTATKGTQVSNHLEGSEMGNCLHGT